MDIQNKLDEMLVISCSKCKTSEMDLFMTNMWVCPNCSHSIRHTPSLDKKKFISGIKLKQYILKSDDSTANKIISVYLKRQGFDNSIIYNSKLIQELLLDLRINRNFNTHKLLNLSDVI